MRTIHHIAKVFVVILAITWFGCDSDGGDPPVSDDATQLFVGDWTLTGADDDSGSRLGDLANRYNSILAGFTSDTTFTVMLDSNNESVPDVNLAGTFSATVDNPIMNLMTVFNGTPVSLTFAYEFVDATQKEVDFSTTATQTGVLNLAFGTDFVGPTTLTFSLIED